MLGRGALCADSMGLGKTLTMLALILATKSDTPLDHSNSTLIGTSPRRSVPGYRLINTLNLLQSFLSPSCPIGRSKSRTMSSLVHSVTAFIMGKTEI